MLTLEEELKKESERRERAELLLEVAERNLESQRGAKKATEQLVQVLKEQLEAKRREAATLRRRNKELYCEARRLRNEAHTSGEWTRLLEERIKFEEPRKSPLVRLGSFLKTKISPKKGRRRLVFSPDRSDLSF
uniref:Branchpoint-bridging protein n=1 Tax=Steinernema glaseri TaxID=37863 RepID=A0A1I7YG62_9BILA